MNENTLRVSNNSQDINDKNQNHLVKGQKVSILNKMSFYFLRRNPGNL